MFLFKGKPIEVINSRTKPDEGFNITEFLKSLIPSGGSPIIPGLNVDPPPQSTLLQTASKSIYSPTAELNTTDQYDYPGQTSTPLQPPPLPPNLFPLEEPSYKYEQSVEREEDAWNTKLPPKFPTWGDTASAWEREEHDKTTEWMPVMPPNKAPPLTLDTPESPPLYEKEGFSDPVEYDDSVVDSVLMSSSGDVDHRTLVQLPQINHTKDTDCRISLPVKHLKDTDHRVIPPVTPANKAKKDMDHRPLMPRKKDVDHRNLISLTGSPVRDNSALPPPPIPRLDWCHSDQDYRTTAIISNLSKKEILQQRDLDYRLHQPHSVGRRQQDENQDNVESVDMEMSDEEMAEEIASEKKEVVTEKDKSFETSQNNKPVISFNINSHSKILANSPLNEVKEDRVRSRSHVYGCQKIPTISGIGGNTHAPRGMGPRPRMPLLLTPQGIKRLPPPSVARSFRPSMMFPPPPVPPLPPHIVLVPQSESFNVAVEIKPQSEIESHVEIQDTLSCEEVALEEEVTTETLLLSLPPSPSPTSEPVLKEQEKPEVKVNSDGRQRTPDPDPEKETAEVNVGSSVTENVRTDETTEDPPNHNEDIATEENVTQVSSIPEIEPVARKGDEHLKKHLEVDGSEHWMNNELAELEKLDMGRMEQDRGQRGRGRPFNNFPRGGFIPRSRPMWNGPMRGGPPVRFPFRPPLDRPFGRGHRGVFRPFRGNHGHFGGW